MAHRTKLLRKPTDPFSDRENAENQEKTGNYRQEHQVGKGDTGLFETRGMSPLKASGKHGVIDPFRTIHGSEKKNPDQSHEHLQTRAASPERTHVPGADDPHRLLHEDKEITIQEKELRNKESRKAESPECMTDAGKRRGRDEQERLALIVSVYFRRIETKEIHPADMKNPGMTAKILVSRSGLKMPMNTAKGATTTIFLMMNRTGISPMVMISTGNRKNGASETISYLGKEMTVSRNNIVAITLARGSRRCMQVS